ncbi:hypothetical protein D3C80_1102420 [compost metagenome]
MLWRRSLTSSWRTSMPSSSRLPLSGWCRPTISLASELLPEPLRPTMPIFSPGRMLRVMSERAACCCSG